MDKIPHIIHYCWFGKNQKPELVEYCISTWKKYFDGWEIKEWNEENYDVTSSPYIKEAYEAKNNCDRRPQTVINTVLAAVTGDVNFIM